MPKTLSAHEWPIAKVFNDDYVFEIPGYQRPYAWGTEQAQELVDDLLGSMPSGETVEQMSPYFLGSIVLIKDEGKPLWYVVDGQQRLTTLTILLAAIRASMSPHSAHEVTPFLYEKGVAILNTPDHFRLTLRQRDCDFFRGFVQKEGGIENLLTHADKLSDSQSRIQNNARLYMDRLQALSQDDILRLAQFILIRCYLVVVSTPDLDAAYRIFSVLNSRGLDLAPTDILKSEIIGAIKSDLSRETYTAKWEDEEEKLGREPFVDLFGHIRMVYRRQKPQGTLIKEFREHVTSAIAPEQFIDGVLLPMGKAYTEIIGEQYESTAQTEVVNEHLRWLNRLEFTDWVPPALAFATRYRQSPGQMADFFRDLERLSYALLIQGAGVNERIERFSRLTAAIADDAPLKGQDSALQLTPLEQHKVYTRLDGPVYETFSARARTTILLRLDKLLSGGGAEYEYKIVSVEHVLPQNPSANSQWMAWFPSETDRLAWVHRLGNLALLSRRKNSAASNYEFNTKKQTYFAKDGVSPFVLTTQVLAKTKWTLEVVEERQKDLLAVLESHWRLTERAAPEVVAHA